MAIDYTADRIEPGDKVKVQGRRTVTEGEFKAVGVNEDGKPRILIDAGYPILFAYDFDEVASIELLERKAGINVGARDGETDRVEESYPGRSLRCQRRRPQWLGGEAVRR